MEQTVHNKSKGMALITSLIISYVLTTLLLLLLAMLLYKTDLTEGKVNIAICGIYVVACFIGGFVFGKKAETKRFLWGAVLGVAYFILLGVISVAVQRGIASDMGHLITSFALCVGGGTIGGMLS